MNSSILNAALNYARQGIPVFPCRLDKKPLTPHGFKDATTDEAQILEWWTTWPGAMIGVPMGAASGLWALDIDCAKAEGDADGFASLQSLTGVHGDLSATRMQQTPSGGIHFIHRYPKDGQKIPNSTSKVAEKIDVRGDGGYIIIAPSVNADGKAYAFLNESLPADAPEWLLSLVRQPTKPVSQCIPPPASNLPSTLEAALSIVEPYAQKALDEECAKVAATPEKARNNTLNASAFSLGTLVGGGELDESLARSRLMGAAMRCGLSPNEAAKTIESGMTSGKQHPRSIPAAATSGKANVSEESIAFTFAARYRDTLRFCTGWGVWLEWTPQKHVWEIDVTNRTFNYIREECKAANPENKPSIGKAATAAGVEKFTRADPLFATITDDWDKDTFLLGTPSGIINLN